MRVMLVALCTAQQQDGGRASWGEMVEEAESRTPGRVVHVHEKLSSPSRKRWVSVPTQHCSSHQLLQLTGIFHCQKLT